MVLAVVKCYIDRTHMPDSTMSYTLRDKLTNRRVDVIFIQESERSALSKFLRHQYEHADLNSGLRNREGPQYVKVSGRILGGSDSLIIALPNGEGVSYYAVID